MDLATAFDYYDRHRFIMFWNPRDITAENLGTDTTDIEALLIKPLNITSAELHEGQYLVEDGRLEPYQPYHRHAGIDKIFEAIKGAGSEFNQMVVAAIKQCVEMGWEIMEAKCGTDSSFFRRYVPSSETPASTLFPRPGSYVPCRRWPPTSK